MFKRYWGVILALGLALLGTPAIWALLEPREPNLPTAEYEQARTGDYQPGGSKCAPKALAAISDKGKRVRETDACAEKAEDHRLQTNDLIQQTRAADAAQAQALLAYQGVWIGVVQTVGGFLTLVAAVAAAAYARSAAQAAQANLAHDRQVHDIMNRPYVVFAGLKLKSDANGGHWVTLKIKNSGASMAVNVRAALFIFYGNVPLGADYRPQFEDSDLHCYSLIAPNGMRPVWATKGMNLSAEQIAAITRMDAGLCAIGVIRYRPLPHLPEEEIIYDWAAVGPHFTKGKFHHIPKWMFGDPEGDGQGNLELGEPAEPEEGPNHDKAP